MGCACLQGVLGILVGIACAWAVHSLNYKEKSYLGLLNVR